MSTKSTYLTLLALLLAACSRGADDNSLEIGPPVAGVVEIDSTGATIVRHGAEAFGRAPQLTIDSVPEVVYGGARGTDFDLLFISEPVRLADGRLVALSMHGDGPLVLFHPTGRPDRVLRAAPGTKNWAESPPIVMGGDTIVVIDRESRSVHLFTAGDGLVATRPLSHWPGALCGRSAGVFPGGRLVRMADCSWGRLPVKSAERPLVPVYTAAIDLSDPDTIGAARIATQLPESVDLGHTVVPFSREYAWSDGALLTVWDSSLAVANGKGYVVDRRSPTGALQLRIAVDRPRRAVTPEVRAAADGEPVPDSLPPYDRIMAVAGGWLWVTDPHFHFDSTATATAFTRDGKVAARLTIPTRRGLRPVWWGGEHVLMREYDADSVIRMKLYRLRLRSDAP